MSGHTVQTHSQTSKFPLVGPTIARRVLTPELPYAAPDAPQNQGEDALTHVAHPHPSAGVPGWRGLLLDCSRSFFSVETIERLLQVMGRYGFNRLHWHLTDNSGWRLDIPAYPRLAEVASQLPRLPFNDYTQVATREVIERAQQEAPHRWKSGIYSATDVRRVLETAAKYGIEVVPEIDLPGHMAAAITAYPQLGNPRLVPNSAPTGTNPRVTARNDLLWPGAVTTSFIHTVLDTVCDLFPSSFIHLGGDECEFSLWHQDPALKTWRRERGIADERGIQTWFMRMAADRVRARGKIPVAWDEVGGIDPDGDYLIIAWDGERGMQRLAQCHQPYVFADMRWLYLNYADPEGGPDQLGFFPPISVDDILQAEWPQIADRRCLGIQACLWTEFVLDETAMWQLLCPRLLAVAERIWDPTGEDSATARERMTQEADWLTRSGWIPAIN